MYSPVRRTAAKIESLEDRKLLAAFGTPWPDPRELTISFPADGAGIGSYSNDIRQEFDQVANRQEWEELALRAFQTWAVTADINVGLRNDSGIDFGTPGLTASDPRFGDFRIGSFPQVGLLANSVPFQAAAGTYSGDVLLNSSTQFKYHDWAGGLAPDPATLGPDDFDLYSVLLHEAGNALGLDDSVDNWTVMFRQYTTPKGALTQDDINEIQALYGARTDPFESVDNGQLQVATIIATPTGFDPDADVIRTQGSLVTGTDVDFYELSPISGRDSVTLRLNAAGISLLESRFEVLDSAGQLIDESVSVSVFDNDNTVQLTGLQNHSTIYLRVSALDSSGVYSVGDYGLEIDYRPAAIQASDPAPGAYDSGAGALHTNFALTDAEQGNNDTTGTAETLIAESFHPGTRYEHESSVSAAADVDVWKVTAPSQVNGRLLVNVAGVGLSQPDLAVQVVDSAGNTVGASGWLRPDGTWALEVAHPQASQDYFVSVSVDPSSSVSVGNYVVAAEFMEPSAQMNDFISADLDSTVDTFIRWTADKTKLFRFDLNASGGLAGEFVKLTIYDAHTQEMRMVLETPSDVTRTALVWLTQGDYVLRFTAYSVSGDPVSIINFTLTGDGISDDQDDHIPDPEEDDEHYTGYDYDHDYYADESYYYEYDSAYDYDYDYDYDYGYGY